MVTNLRELTMNSLDEYQMNFNLQRYCFAVSFVLAEGVRCLVRAG